MAPHSSTLAWKTPWMEEPGGLQSMESLGVRHDWEISLSLFTFLHWRRKWQPTPVFLPGESQGQGACWAAIYGVPQSRTRLKRLSSSSSIDLLHMFVSIWMEAEWLNISRKYTLLIKENTVSLANIYYFKNSWFVFIKLTILAFYYGITYFLQKYLGLFSFLSPWFKPSSHHCLINH